MNNRVRVKICGITCLEDALAAVNAGADALGFMFYQQSSRNITPQRAADVIGKLPPFITKVGVFVDASEEFLRDVLAHVRLDALQFHGNESPEQCERSKMPVVKAFRILDESSLKPLAAYRTSAWLLDSFVPGQSGGTGTTFNWALAKRAGAHGPPIILAGGLTPENVAEAVRLTRPFGVDVSSGVESSPGRKDPAKMEAFITAVRAASD